MIPQNNINIDITELEYVTLPTKTYRFDITNKRIIGMTDELDAYRISVEKALRTGRYDHVIYDGSYGSGIHKYIGQDFDFVKSDCEREIYECLSQDDRFQGVRDFIITQTGLDHCTIKFNVISNLGTFAVEIEV